MDMVSLSRDEVSRTLGLTPEAVDALIRGGHILCHVVNGEPRIPVDQLEDFFRSGLLRVYRIQAAESTPNAIAEPEPAPVEAALPAPKDIEVALPEAMPEVTRPAVTLVEEKEEEEQYDLRAAPRYIPRRQINGIIDDIKFTIVQISRTGLRIRHRDEILPVADSKLTFALLNPARSFVMRGRVVWTSAATTESGERKFYISGVRITEHADRLVGAIEILNASHDLQPDRRAAFRASGEDEALPVAGASDDEIAMVMKAVHHFASDPLDANRWYARGRFALADPQVRRDAPQKHREREEVLGIWEFLDRKIEMTKITDIMSWARKSKATAPAARA